MARKRKIRWTRILVLAAIVIILYPVVSSHRLADNLPSIVVPEPPPIPEVPDYVALMDQPIKVPEPPADFDPPPLGGEEEAGSGQVVVKPSLDSSGIPISWTLQLAAYSQYTKASALLSQLRKNSYRAYIREGVGDDGEILYRVYVGPDLGKNKLIALLQPIQKKYALKGRVVRFRP